MLVAVDHGHGPGFFEHPSVAGVGWRLELVEPGEQRIAIAQPGHPLGVAVGVESSVDQGHQSVHLGGHELVVGVGDQRSGQQDPLVFAGECHGALLVEHAAGFEVDVEVVVVRR